jgi:hypothetical protein
MRRVPWWWSVKRGHVEEKGEDADATLKISARGEALPPDHNNNMSLCFRACVASISEGQCRTGQYQ